MSTDEEMAALGRMVTEYGAALRHLTTLQAEAQRIGGLIQPIIRALESTCEEQPLPQNWETLDQDKIKSLLDEMSETRKRINNLRAQLASLGIVV